MISFRYDSMALHNRSHRALLRLLVFPVSRYFTLMAGQTRKKLGYWFKEAAMTYITKAVHTGAKLGSNPVQPIGI